MPRRTTASCDRDLLVAARSASFPTVGQATFWLPGRSGIVLLGLLLCAMPSASSAQTTSLAAAEGTLAPPPSERLAAAGNALPRPVSPSRHERFSEAPSAGAANASSPAPNPSAAETPSWLIALSLDGTSQAGVIGTREDSDFFRIDIDELTMVEISTSADFLPETVLLDAEGHELASGRWMTRRLLPAGRYYLRVSAHRYFSFTELETGRYTVVAEGTSASPASIELGDQSLVGTIDSDGDEDFFQFEVTEPKEVNIYTIGGVDSLGRVFASDGRWLAENDDDGDESNFRIQRVLWPGQYYVGVSGKAGETGSYTLRAEGLQLSSVPISEGGSPGNVEQRFAHDYFQFEIAEVSEAVIYTEGNLDTLGELLDASGNLIDGSDSGGEGANFRMRSVLPQAGTYYLRIMAWGGSTGDYTVHLEQTALSPVELSPDGSPQEGVIEAEADSDYFQFELAELTIAAIYSVGGFDSFGKLLDAAGREITSNDDGGDGDNFRIHRLLWPGKYYVRVTSSLSATTGSYTLHLEGTQPSIAALGLDDSPSSGAITKSDESNFFRIETAVPTVALVYTVGSLDTAGSLHDSEGKEVASNDDGGEQFVNFRIAATLLRPGRYILRVYMSSGQTGSYTVHASGITGE